MAPGVCEWEMGFAKRSNRPHYQHTRLSYIWGTRIHSRIKHMKTDVRQKNGFVLVEASRNPVEETSVRRFVLEFERKVPEIRELSQRLIYVFPKPFKARSTVDRRWFYRR